ncbi:MAG: hypothetical protein Q8P67_00475, partial [archaeon]|nr:hypothetical protein [archaeon]
MTEPTGQYDQQVGPSEWQRVTEQMVGFMRRVLSSPRAHSRGSCTAGERELGRMILEAWKSDGHQVREEPFWCAPTAFLGFFPLLGILYACCALLLAADAHSYALGLS